MYCKVNFGNREYCAFTIGFIDGVLLLIKLSRSKVSYFIGETSFLELFILGSFELEGVGENSCLALLISGSFKLGFSIFCLC